MIHTFSNGLRLVYQERLAPITYVGIMINKGTRNEPYELNGLAHYVEHTVFKGTEMFSARQIINQIEGVGGEINAYTNKEETAFYAVTPNAHFFKTLEVLCQMVTAPTFPPHETQKEVGVILDEIESYNDAPSELIYDDFEALIFNHHPLEKRILGTKKTLQKIASSPLYAQQWVQNQFVATNMIIFVLGTVAPEKIIRRIEQLLPSFPTQNGILEPNKPVIEAATTQISYKKHTHQTHCMLGSFGYPYNHPKQLKLFLLNNILGGGSLNSRLNTRLREKNGLVYTVESQYTPLSDTGYWSVYFACDNVHYQHCLDLVLGELKSLRDERLSDASLKKALQQLRGQLAIASENAENNALLMAKQLFYYGFNQTWEETFEHIATTTSDELQQIANEVYAEERLFFLSYK